MRRLGLVVVIAASAGGCAGVRASPDRDASGSSDGGPGMTLSGDASPDAGGPPLDAGTARSCSADLRSVVDSFGAVVERCPSDQGCAGGGCVPACEAAATEHGSVGCAFVVPTPAFEAWTAPPCFAVFLTNGWAAPAQISVTRGSESYDVTRFARIAAAGLPPPAWAAVTAAGLPPNQVAVLFLSSDPTSNNQGASLDCPDAPAVAAGTAIWEVTGVGLDGSPKRTSATGRGQSWRISTSVPVNGYDILPYGGARSYLPSAQLLLPTTSWGTSYVAAMPRLGNANEGWAQVVAANDDTQVTVLPAVDLPGGAALPTAPRGALASFSLDAGEYLQWQWFEIGTDMSGSIVSSDKPVMFVGGTGRLCLSSATSTGGGCDAEHELVPPVSALGWEYVAPPYTTRRADLQPESELYRIVAAVDGTILTYDPPVAGAPATMDRGAMDFEANGAFVVASQDARHPFMLAQQMPGCAVTGGSRPGVDPSAPMAAENCLGDEDDVGVIPPAQWLSHYVFFTDPAYATTNIVVVREKTSTGFHDVNVDCAGPLSGWQAVGASGRYELTNIDFVRGGRPNGTCGNGPHTATSDAPFALVVWGLDAYASYGYPAGGNFRPINPVVID